ncbi:MAG: phosphate ABC transporter substrate-binding protein [Clostridiaceae bacterium]
MKKRNLRIMMAALAVMIVGGTFAGCGNNGNSNKLSGSITAAGSTALQPLAEQAGKAFTEKNPEAVINVQGGGSGTGLKLVSEGTANIGNSDVAAEKKLDKALADQLTDYKVCGIGFAVVVNKDVQVDSLTAEQIQDIFTGKVTNWKEVGGQDLKIEVVHRAKSSGTRATFVETVMGGVDENDGIGTMQDSSGAVEKAIAGTQGSISYLAMSYLTDEVKKNVSPIKIDGTEASKANIISGTYKFWSYEHMYTKGEATGVTKAFIDYIMSDECKPLVEKLGYIPASDLK